MNEDKMELEEAIKELESLSPSENAIKTVLQELEDKDIEIHKLKQSNAETAFRINEQYIPKKKIEARIKLIEMEEHYDYKINYTSKQVKEVLQELLEDK